jgi:hypothetical protein
VAIDKKKSLKEASFSELASLSKYTIFGIIFFVITIIIMIVVQTQLFEFSEDQLRLILNGLFFFSLLSVLLGLEIDILRWRDFSDWGALGAFIAYIGHILFFLPIILDIFIREDNLILVGFTIGRDIFFVLFISLPGLLFIIIGFTSHATALDRKIEETLSNFWKALRNFNFRLFLVSIFVLIGSLIVGSVKYLRDGLKNLLTRISMFIRLVYQALKTFVNSAWIFFTQTFPAIIKRSLIVLWRNFHWFGLIGVIIYVLRINFLNEEFYVNIEILIIVGFFFSLGVIYPQLERLARVVHRVQDYSWEASYKLNYRLRTIAEGRRKIKCTSCDQVIPLGSRECEFCEKEVSRCMICKLPIKTGQIPTECPYCKNTAHEDHWKFWINLKKDCPACKRVIPS